MNLVRALFLLLACATAVSVQAFRSTDFESFTDPDFVGYRPARVIVVVEGADFQLSREIEKRFIDELRERGVEGFPAMEIFPPTRPIESYNVLDELAKRMIDSALVVSSGERASNVTQFGAQTNTTVNVYGNQATASSSTTPMISASSRAEFTASLLAFGPDASSRTAWFAQVLVKASGTFFVGNNKSDAKGAVRGILQGLIKDGHLPE